MMEIMNLIDIPETTTAIGKRFIQMIVIVRSHHWQFDIEHFVSEEI